MNKDELKSIAENLIDTFKMAGKESIDSLKIEIKSLQLVMVTKLTI